MALAKVGIPRVLQQECRFQVVGCKADYKVLGLRSQELDLGFEVALEHKQADMALARFLASRPVHSEADMALAQLQAGRLVRSEVDTALAQLQADRLVR